MPVREIKIIKEAISNFNLDLDGLTIFTEAASGDYAFTSIMAAVADADLVYAFAKDSKYARARDVKENIEHIAELYNLSNKVEVIFEKNNEYLKSADIITNSGFVRPIDKIMIDSIKKTAVIPLMFETWEFRETDIDINYCRKNEIPVLGTNERSRHLNLFNANGFLAAKVIFDAGFEVYGNKILIIGSGIVGKSIQDFFNRNYIDNIRITFDKTETDPANSILNSEDFEENAYNPDIILVCEHVFNRPIIAPSGIINQKNIANFTDAKICHICGDLDTEFIQNNNLSIYPDNPAKFGFQSFHIGHLGPKHVIELNCAGLKVGEIMARLRLEGLSYPDTIKEAVKHDLVMDFGGKT